MKFLVATLLTLMAFQAQAASFESRICTDQFAKQFPWTLSMSIENNQVTKVWSAENTVAGKKPVYKEIKVLIPNPANKASQGETQYKIAIETIQGTVSGTMNVSAKGVVNIWMGEERYLLFCEAAN